MNIQERINHHQSQANNIAVQETNLREQINKLKALKAELEQLNRTKHQHLGALAILNEQAAMEAEAQKAATANPGE